MVTVLSKLKLQMKNFLSSTGLNGCHQTNETPYPRELWKIFQDAVNQLSFLVMANLASSQAKPFLRFARALVAKKQAINDRLSRSSLTYFALFYLLHVIRPYQRPNHIHQNIMEVCDRAVRHF
jgi:hypothetical protein